MQRIVPLRPSRWVAIGLDSVLVVAAYGGALFFRLQGSVPSWYAERFAASIIVIVATYVVIGLLNRVYSPRERCSGFSRRPFSAYASLPLLTSWHARSHCR